MKRILVVMLVLGALGIGWISCWADDHAVTYDLVSESFAEMLDVLDYAIPLVVSASIAARTPEWLRDDLQRGELRAYVQEIVNLLEGPESDLFDAEGGLGMRPTLGLIPLLDQTRSQYDGPSIKMIFPDYPQGYSNEMMSCVLAWMFVDSALQEATRVAQSMIHPEDDSPRTQELASLYSLLVAARGGDLDAFPLGGAWILTQTVPTRRIWVESYESIQEAIDRVPNGGTVYVAPGVYKEMLSVRKNVQIVAASHAPDGLPEMGRTVIEGVRWRGLIEVASEDGIEVSIRGLVLRNAGAGISVIGPCSVAVQDVLFEENGSGLDLALGATAEVQACRFVGNKTAVEVFQSEASLRGSVIEASWPGGLGLSVFDGRARLVDCVIQDQSGPAVSVFSVTSEIDLVNCDLVRNGLGLEIHGDVCDSEEAAEQQSYGGYCIGEITGWGNRIPDQDEPDGNSGGAFDTYGPPPGPDLSFLTEPETDTE